MNLSDLPQPAAPELYREATQRYAEMVRQRAAAVYRLGEIDCPGLSPLNLLVVTGHCGVGNGPYFSALQRLPRRFCRVFPREPSILPAWSLRVMQYVPDRGAALLSGRHVIDGYRSSDAPQERYCRILETYCFLAHFRRQVNERQLLPGRKAIEATTAFRDLLFEAQGFLEGVSAGEYADQLERLRGTFFKRGSPADNVAAAWTLFETKFSRFERALRRKLGASKSEQTANLARALIRGDTDRAGWDRAYAFQRTRDIDAYHRDLASLGIPYGQLFPAAAHPELVRSVESSLLGKIVRNLYRVRRRLEEFAGA